MRRPKLAALAASVRDRIPDLPFALPPDPMLEELKRMDGGTPEPPPTGPDREAAADTLEGPWDEAAANGTTGELYFLRAALMRPRPSSLGRLGFLTVLCGCCRVRSPATRRHFRWAWARATINSILRALNVREQMQGSGGLQTDPVISVNMGRY